VAVVVEVPFSAGWLAPFDVRGRAGWREGLGGTVVVHEFAGSQSGRYAILSNRIAVMVLKSIVHRCFPLGRSMPIDGVVSRDVAISSRPDARP
jgi:hypothetical protein